MVAGGQGGVLPSIHEEGVGVASRHTDDRDEGIVNVPSNTPPCDACKQGGGTQRKGVFTQACQTDFEAASNWFGVFTLKTA